LSRAFKKEGSLAAKVSQRPCPRNEESDAIARPFLRWVGGKFNLATRLMDFLPPDIHERTYFEPFLGAGALFFALQHRRAYLSDLNHHLIDCYQVIRERPADVAAALRRHISQDSEKYYYDVRDLYNQSRRGVQRAARFVYLNRTGFNGVFRVNVDGKYNVPYGRKANPRFPTKAELQKIADVLAPVSLHADTYEVALERARRGDFIYLDPPYPPLNGTAYFTHYTAGRFASEDQEKVAAEVRRLDKLGCLLMVSNADTPSIRHLYRGFRINSMNVRRFVSSGKKNSVNELVITNYR
jgi:DNA adenine methylase